MIMTEPLGYIDFLSLTSHARIVLTDSGGLQEESTALGIPCLTLRENTERPGHRHDGTNRIVGMRTQAILASFEDAMAGRVPPRRPPLWDGADRSPHRRGADGISVEMNWSTFVTRGKKAMRMPPRVLLARLQDEVKQQTKRPWATAYPHLLNRPNGAWRRGERHEVVGVAAGVRPFLPAPGRSRTMVISFSIPLSRTGRVPRHGCRAGGESRIRSARIGSGQRRAVLCRGTATSRPAASGRFDSARTSSISNLIDPPM